MLVGSDVSLVDEPAELLTACYSRGALEERPLQSCKDAPPS
jgi:hypothetical protein